MKTPTKPQAKPAPEPITWTPPTPGVSGPVRRFILDDPDIRRLAVALRDGLKDVAFGPDLAQARETVAALIFASKG